MTGGTTAGSGRSFRLDPDVLPARGFIEAGGGTFHLDHHRAVIRPADGALGDAVIVGVEDFSGITVRVEHSANPVRLTLELTHPNPALCLPLADSDMPEALADDWQKWSRALDLPLIVAFPDGTSSKYYGTGDAPVIGAPKPRRGHAYLAGRRPRFLKRRKTGFAGASAIVTSREIIART